MTSPHRRDLTGDWVARLESVQTDTQSERAVTDAYQMLRDARNIADMAAWYHAKFRGYPVSRGAAAAGVTRPTFYRDIERHEEHMSKTQTEANATYTTPRGDYGQHTEYELTATAEQITDPENDDHGRWQVTLSGTVYEHQAGGGISGSHSYEDYEVSYYDDQPTKADLLEEIETSVNSNGDLTREPA